MSDVYYTTKFPGYVVQEFTIENLKKYDVEYLEKYARFDKFKTETLNALRLDKILEHIYSDNIKLLEVGYGTGEFLKSAANSEYINIDAYGYDVIPSELPKKVKRVERIDDTFICKEDRVKSFDVVCFFDSLEHIEVSDIRDYLKLFDTKYIFVSVPWYHYHESTEWFRDWYHRRPNEHLHHFDSFGLMTLLSSIGYDIIHISNFEDEIRKSKSHLPNILSVIAKKRD